MDLGPSNDTQADLNRRRALISKANGICFEVANQLGDRDTAEESAAYLQKRIANATMRHIASAEDYLQDYNPARAQLAHEHLIRLFNLYRV